MSKVKKIKSESKVPRIAPWKVNKRVSVLAELKNSHTWQISF